LLSGKLSAEPAAWQQVLQKALAQPIKPQTPRPYADDTRYVLHDASLQVLAAASSTVLSERRAGKRSAPIRKPVRSATANRPEKSPGGEALLRVPVATTSGSRPGTRLSSGHGSYKALSWSRDLAIKWLALLAHYVSDAELDYLPIAGTPGPAIDYVHHDMPVEGMYAAALVILFKVKRPLRTRSTNLSRRV